MTIADAFNEITIAQGGTPNYSGTIAAAIDALNDTLAGSDQPAETTIEGAVRLLGEHIGGGSSITVEALSATENKTYTAPEGKAYSPVTVNVAAQEYDIVCKYDGETTSSFVYPPKWDGEVFVADTDSDPLTKAKAGELIVPYRSLDYIQVGFSYGGHDVPLAEGAEYALVLMPSATLQVDAFPD